MPQERRRRLLAGVAALWLLASVPAGVARARSDEAASTRTTTACPAPVLGPRRVPGRPGLATAIVYARGRRGDIAFAVRYAGGFYGYRPDHREWSASVLKAMLLVAYLDRPSVAQRPLDGGEQTTLRAMITRSDNDAADQIDTIVGAGGLRALAARVGMHSFVSAEPIWGESQITARDQTRFFLQIESALAPRHRAYAMKLLAGIVPSQRWGIGQVRPAGWKLYFKGGWGSGTGLIDNQVALLARGCARISVAVLSMHDGSHAYGKQTLRGIFARLLGRLGDAAP
jgi:Beta-lactamase enzyme family